MTATLATILGEAELRYRLVCTVVVLALLTGCNSKPALMLYCGAGIRPPVAEAVEEFGRVHGVRVECAYAGSEVLLSQMQLSGRGDLYMPGDGYYVEQAEQAGLIVSTRPVCCFVPVVLVQKGNPHGIRTLRDLAQPGLVVGLGEAEACAVGRQTSQLFAKNNISEEDINRNVANRALTVSDLANGVKLHALDAAIVWDAVAAGVADQTDVVPIAPAQNIVSTVSIAILKSSSNRELSQQFVDFLASERGQAIFAKHHYTLCPPKEGPVEE
jgi:molybdate transport system substrate-binding protein